MPGPAQRDSTAPARGHQSAARISLHHPASSDSAKRTNLDVKQNPNTLPLLPPLSQKLQQIAQPRHPLPRLAYRLKRAHILPLALVDLLVDAETPLQRAVVREHHDAVLGQVQIRLEGVRAGVERRAEGEERVLGVEGFVAAVRDRLRERRRGGGGALQGAGELGCARGRIVSLVEREEK